PAEGTVFAPLAVAGTIDHLDPLLELVQVHRNLPGHESVESVGSKTSCCARCHRSNRFNRSNRFSLSAGSVVEFICKQDERGFWQSAACQRVGESPPVPGRDPGGTQVASARLG